MHAASTIADGRYSGTSNTAVTVNPYDRQMVNAIQEDQDSQPPCLNCSLIQQGSAITYGDNRCPQCGRDVGL